MEYEPKQIKIDKNLFHYRIYGEGQGLICLFHGLGDRLSTFSMQIEFLVLQGYKCLAFDFPGCGENKDTVLPPDSTLDLIEKMVRIERHKTILLIGHSLGGLFALRLAERLKVDTNVKVCVIEGTLLECDLDFFNSIAIDGAKPACELASKLQPDMVPATYLQSYQEYLCSMSSRAFVFYVYDVRENFVRYRTAIETGMDIITYYCYGTKSPCPEERQLLGKKKMIVISFEGCGHWVHIESPDEFNQVMLRIARAP